MPESITISRKKPAIKSMDFQFLKEEGIRRIQELSGDIWTDYNEHDPGVTLLEVLCYAITDLGYRTSFDMKDLLAPNPNDQVTDNYDFFTARQILHNNPLTIQDYRKLLMDVSTLISGDEFEDEIIGIKNAWITISEKAEFDLFVNREDNYLDYLPPKIGDQTPIDLKVLYDVVLEFSDSKNFGDLNSDTLEQSYSGFHPNVVALFLGQPHYESEILQPYDQNLYTRLKLMSPEDLQNALNQVGGLLDVLVKVKMEFPRWDETDLDWTNINSIKSAVRKITMTFFNLPDDFNIIYKLDEDNNILMASGKDGLKGKPVPFLDDITNRINCLVLGQVDSLIITYQQKVLNILEILSKAKARLNVHRNLCEDFYSFNALRVEEILVCTDIDIEPNANVAEIEGNIFYELDKFLSPTVNFYSLEEILEKDLADKKYHQLSIDKDNNRITIFSTVRQILEEGSIVSLSGFGAEIIEVTVSVISKNILNEGHTDITVNEDLSLITSAEDGYLLIGKFEENQLRPMEEVFDGPALGNGFIDNDELKIADRRSYIHASDIINLIMDVQGVIAVRSLEIANFPQDENPEVKSKSVRWCLKIATDKNYVPRISTSKSRITYYKDNLPFQPGKLAAEEVFNTLKDNQRPQKPMNPTLDFDVPEGEYRELADYVSVQDDLPLTYGVGIDGVPVDYLEKEDAQSRKSKARQLKGYLMVFDQLLANYLTQLDRMKDLFSFNPERKNQIDGGDVLPEEYNFQVNKTYFSQPLFDVVADAIPLYAKFDDQKPENENRQFHADRLQKIIEDRSSFVGRRNKFLDHLIARFGEQFTDYALLTARIEDSSREEIDLELIEDKQDFLNMYPDISANRGKAFDYKSPLFWHQENISGLEKRVAFLSGIDPAEVNDLFFNPAFIKIEKRSDFYQILFKNGLDIILQSTNVFSSEKDAKLATEKLILYGLCEQNFSFKCIKKGSKKAYSVYLKMNNEVVAERPGTLDSELEVNTAIEEYIQLFKDEFFENPLANRKNFSLPFNNYFIAKIEDLDIDIPNETYQIAFKLYAFPFSFEENQLLLEGIYQGQIESKDIDSLENIKSSAQQKVREQFWEVVYLGREAYQATQLSDRITIINRLGEEVARGNVAQINQVLSEIKPSETESTSYEQAVERLNIFIERNFFRQEGFHLLEHILLRPKVNNVWVPAKTEFIREIPEKDSFIPVDKELETDVSIKKGKILLKGDYSGDLELNQQITLTGKSTAETYKIDTFSVEDDQTVITTRNTISKTISKSSNLKVSVLIHLRIVDVRDEELALVLEEGTSSDLLTEGKEISLLGARDNQNYGQYTILSVTKEDDKLVVTLDQFKIRDKLLPIYLPTADNDIEDPHDCDSCKIDNPYSYIAQVVVPGWPGRLDNIDFRGFFEKSIRMEAPAHIFLNVCWIGYDQMETFEYRYKNWLLENLKEFPVKPYDNSDKERLTKLSRAKAALIDSLYELRNIYPVRSLHDCEEGESTEGAIILNQTALGEI